MTSSNDCHSRDVTVTCRVTSYHPDRDRDVTTNVNCETVKNCRHNQLLRRSSCGLIAVTSHVSLLLLPLILLLSVIITPADASKGVYGGDYCDTEVFRAECADGEVIIMQKALYGRLKIGRCVEIDLGYIGCFTDVLVAADRRCSGKRVCEIRVPDAEFESTRPCLKELKTYLEASYQCVSVETVTTDYCKTHDQLNVSAASTSGYIASVVTSDTPYCDGSSHPWLIVGQPGQTINLTLYDFALQETAHASSRNHYNSNVGGRRQGQQQQQQQQQVSVATIDSSSVGGASVATNDGLTCIQYGLVEDSGTPRSTSSVVSGLSAAAARGVERPTTICSNGKDRVRHIYHSTGHVVRVWVTAGSAPTDLKRFIIHYAVTGCPDPDISAHAWFTRSADGNGVMGCKFSSDTSPLRCVDHVWKGTFTNCSEFRLTVIDKDDSELDLDQLSYGKHSDTAAVGVSASQHWLNSRILTIGILVGTLAGAICLILVIISVAFRRHRDSGDDNTGRQSVLLRKRQTETDTKMAAVTTDYFYDSTIGGTTAATGLYNKRTPASVTEGNGILSSPATEPLMSAERRIQHQVVNGTTDHHVVTVRCWPNDHGGGGGGDVTMTSCSTFKMPPEPPTINCVAASQIYAKDGSFLVQHQAVPTKVNGRGAV